MEFLFLGAFVFCVWLQSYGAIPLQTTPPTKTTSQRLDCFPSGFEFAYDDVIDEGNFPDDQTCWEIKCGINGRFIKSLTECKRPSTPSPTTHALNVDSECIFNNNKFKPGEDIQSISDNQSNRCYGTRCNKHGQIVAWENFNCFTRAVYYSTTEEEGVKTTPSSLYSDDDTSTQITPNAGCFENSVIYQPGEEITYEYFSDNQTCCGKYCNFNNKVITWRKEHCDDVSTTFEPSLTTTESVFTTKRPGCLVDGHLYEPNSNIDSGNDGSSWCFGRYCDEYSVVTFWDNFHCDVTNTSLTPTLRSKAAYDSTLTPTEGLVTKEPFVTKTSMVESTENFEDNLTGAVDKNQHNIFQQIQNLWNMGK